MQNVWNPKILSHIANGSAIVKPGVAISTIADGISSTADEAAEELAKYYSTVFHPKADAYLTTALILP